MRLGLASVMLASGAHEGVEVGVPPCAGVVLVRVYDAKQWTLRVVSGGQDRIANVPGVSSPHTACSTEVVGRPLAHEAHSAREDAGPSVWRPFRRW